MPETPAPTTIVWMSRPGRTSASMLSASKAVKTRSGDLVVVIGHRVGAREQLGEIREVFDGDARRAK
jgi:hypothetical protein